MAATFKTLGRVRPMHVGHPLLVLLCAGSLSCANAPELVQVDGVVTKDGKPLSHIQVIFYPDHEAGTRGPEARGFTDQAGRYQLGTHTDGDGAVPGKHRVCLVDGKGRKFPGEKPTERSRVALEYSSVSKTPLRNIDVKPGKQTHNFDVR